MLKMKPAPCLGALLAALAMAAPRPALANGVSDDRVSLPDGPGSIRGIGENLELDPNMGQMRYAVELALPLGFASNTPALSLRYSSGAGASVVGIGWDLAVPSIERATNRGLPLYTLDDRFAADGGTELVEVSLGVYRARFEKDFVRYTWHDRAEGRAGYFTAEYPDGRVGYFGADMNGAPVTSRVEGSVDGAAGSVFRYMLVDMLDVHGHRVHYEYDPHGGNTPLLSRISYAYDEETPRYTVELAYELRADVISDCAPGFEQLTQHRLTRVVTRSRSDVLQTVSLVYEDYANAGGASRLARVETRGAEGGLHPAVQRFAYSKSLGAVCDADCASPLLVSMGKVAGAAGMISGQATFADLNGDGLPDLVSSNAPGAAHTIFLSKLDDSLKPTFEPGMLSALALSETGWDFAEPSIQAFDINGDGLTDVYDRVQGRALCNGGDGDWSEAGCLDDHTADATFVDDPDDADGAEDPSPMNVRFLDYDGDKRVDWIRTDSASSAVIFRNTQAGFLAAQSVQGVGFEFDNVGVDTVQAIFADMNGDGLQDPTQISVSGGVATVSYRLNLGYARWGEMRTVSPVGSAPPSARWELEDVNGDGLDDLVSVIGSEVQFALNQNGNQFAPFTVIAASGAADHVVANLPSRMADTTVLFADMNGNGTTDVVWLQADGTVDFLDLSPVRPNLLSRIENGLGGVQTVKYGTAAEQAALSAREGEPWSRKLQQPMNVVVERDAWVTLTGGEGGAGLHEVEQLRYRDGHYDGVNKHFRGFAQVVETLLGSESQEGGETRLRFDPADDPYRNGLLLESAVWANPGASQRLLRREQHTFADCPLDGVSGPLTLPVRYVCETRSEQVIAEGASSSDWITLRTDSTYDGYGNVTFREEQGVVAIGGADCGKSCTGDELTTQTSFIAPGVSQAHPWLLHLPLSMATWGHDGVKTDARYFYDGADFQGLAAGQVDKGLLTRMSEAVSESESIDSQRLAHDGHGNVVAALDPSGDPDMPDGHRRDYSYTPDGLRLARVEVRLTDDGGQPYQLRRDISYHTVYDQPSESTDWMVVQGGSVSSPRNVTAYAYDEFQRLVARAKPGDTLDAPTEVFGYELSDPVSAIVVQQRSERGGSLDIERITCHDGLGRSVQERTRLADASYQVTGFTEYNNRGAVVRSFQPFMATGRTCDVSAPEGTLAYAMRYDATGREIERRYPDEDLYSSASSTRTAYLPLATLAYDEEDTDEDSPHFNTPTVTRRDGLGRIVEVLRYLDDYDQTEGQAISVSYDGLGRMTSYTDPEGNVKRASYDLLGRTLSVVDPNAGSVSYEYDAAGNLTSRSDARGVRTEARYDGNNRVTARFDAAAPEGGVQLSYDLAPVDCDDCAQLAGRTAQESFALEGDQRGRRLFGYDGRGRATFTALELGALVLPTLYSYDNVDRLVETRFADGQVERLGYDPGTRLSSIDGVLDALEYDARNTLTRVRYHNGATRSASYDSRMRLSSLTIEAGDGTLISDFNYTRDRVGNLVAIDNAADGALGVHQDFVYDDWYRTLTATFSAEGDAVEIVESSYDGIDNVLTRVSSAGDASRVHQGTLSYAGPQPSAVTEAGGVQRTYDAAGQMSARGETTLSWDYRGMLSRIEGAGHDLRFVYDAGDLPVVSQDGQGGRSVFVGPSFEVHDGISVWYARSGMGRFARSESDALASLFFSDMDGDGHIRAHDAFLFAQQGAKHGESDDGAATGLGMLRSAARRLLMETRGAVRFLHQDDIYSVIAASDAEGAAVARRGFYPDGALRYEEGAVDAYGFTDQRSIEGTPLLRYKHRVLDTDSGRWLSPDPQFEAMNEDAVTSAGEGIDAYAYIAGRGVNDYDPDGLRGKKKGGGTHASGGHAGSSASTKSRKGGDHSSHYATFSVGDHASGPLAASHESSSTLTHRGEAQLSQRRDAAREKRAAAQAKADFLAAHPELVERQKRIAEQKSIVRKSQGKVALVALAFGVVGAGIGLAIDPDNPAVIAGTTALVGAGGGLGATLHWNDKIRMAKAHIRYAQTGKWRW